MGPVLTECCPCQCAGSLPQQANPIVTVQGPHTAFPTQRFNEVFSFGSFPPQLSINTVATTNYGVPSFPTYSTYSPIEPPSPQPIVETINPPPYSPNVESVTIIENYPPATQTIQVESFPPTANVAEIYQTPITVQIPSPPVSVPPPLPTPPQNIIQEIYTHNIGPETKIVETEIVTTSVPVETPTLNIPSCVPPPPSILGGCSSQPLPVTLQVNLASPSWNPEPVLAVVPQPAPAPSPYSSFNPSFEMPLAPPPIIVMEKSKSSLKSILPILMLSLFDGGCGNNGGGGCSCSQCSASIPIPFPIVVPTNNPIITRGRSKGKASTNAQS